MIEIIKREIQLADSQHPVTAKRLCEILREQGVFTTERHIRKEIERLRDEPLPILATKTRKPFGYFWARTAKEVESYRIELKQHALKQLSTIKKIEMAFFGGQADKDRELFRLLEAQ